MYLCNFNFHSLLALWASWEKRGIRNNNDNNNICKLDEVMIVGSQAWGSTILNGGKKNTSLVKRVLFFPYFLAVIF